MKKVFFILPICIISVFIFSFFLNCNIAVSYKSPKGYDFTKPQIFLLPSVLNEISGITFLKGYSDTILAIEDEDGKLYSYCFSSKKISRSKFGKKGDYEDVTILNNNKVAVLKSDGSIFLFSTREINKEKIDTVEEYNAILPAGEYEGLFADKDTLFALCKKCAADKHAKEVTIYALVQGAGKALTVAHSFTIDISTIQLQSATGKVKFHPAALAKNPVTNNWYLLSSVNKLLLVLDVSWNVKDVYPIDPALFNQPEGIVFNDKGDLYISNEGGAGIANILLFSYVKQ